MIQGPDRENQKKNKKPSGRVFPGNDFAQERCNQRSTGKCEALIQGKNLVLVGVAGSFPRTRKGNMEKIGDKMRKLPLRNLKRI